MQTYGDQFLGEFKTVLSELDKLTQTDYDEQQIRDHVSKIGTKTELFLKAVLFPSKNPRKNFEYFIDLLSGCGVTQGDIDNFHVLRKKYNIAKHAPNTKVTLLDSIDTVRNAEAAAIKTVSLNFGLCGMRINPNDSRVFWVAAWDHYIGGDTEVLVLLPCESEHWLGPPPFDRIYVNLLDWDDIKTELGAAGVLRDGKDLIPKSQYEKFRADDDFLQALVFEGDYRHLITILAQHEKRQELLAGLNRHDTAQSMLLAYQLAAVDVTGTATSTEDFKKALIERAIEVYAVPDDYEHSKVIADEFVEFIGQIDVADWVQICGPIWVAEDKYSTYIDSFIAKHPSRDFIIGNDFVLRAKWTS